MHANGLLVTLAFLCLTGCARYEYELLQPGDRRRHVGTETDQLFRLDPSEYNLRTVDNRLVMRACNRTDRPTQLLGEQSIVVAPDGESHRLRGRTIAPGSHVKLICPPPRPRFHNTGPSFGVGVGVGTAGYHRHPGYPYHYPYHAEPTYMTMYEPAEALYWDWKGESDVRIILVYSPIGPGAATAPASDEIRHEFTFHRRKM